MSYLKSVEQLKGGPCCRCPRAVWVSSWLCLACNTSGFNHIAPGMGMGFSLELELGVRQVHTVSMSDLDYFLFYKEEKITTIWKNFGSFERA